MVHWEPSLDPKLLEKMREKTAAAVKTYQAYQEGKKKYNKIKK